ncbi:MAG: type sorting protein [Bacteroidota bacterium]|nr:type sorting protein [Bacteroidota bacterium]
MFHAQQTHFYIINCQKIFNIPVTFLIIFWFVPTDDFLRLLPKEIEIQIRLELDLIDKLDRGEMNSAQACEALKGLPSYFGLCAEQSANIMNLSISPNPVTAHILNLKFILKETSDIIITIHDYNGNVIQAFPSESIKAGKVEKEIRIDGKISSGIYLLSLSDDKGVRVVKRSVVN